MKQTRRQISVLKIMIITFNFVKYLRNKVDISKQQYGFMPRKETTDVSLDLFPERRFKSSIFFYVDC